MVLLTSSTISVIISSGVVCTFTFLLFLSGYVLQQQTVRSLQDALRNSPGGLTVPTPTLPPQFQVVHEYEAESNNLGGRQLVLSDSAARTVLRDANEEAIVKKLWHDYVQGSSSLEAVEGDELSIPNPEREATKETKLIVSKERLGYILAMPDTNSLCSAVAFTKKHKALTQLMVQPSIVFIYPATWDVSSDTNHMAAMDLLRDMQDNFSVTLHPVTISRVWAGISVEQQLLAELQRYRWPYDRAMYLGSPGMLIDTAMLDQALALSDTKASWTLLHPSPKSHEASHPPMLMWASGRGLLYPRKDAKKLISRASTTHANHHADELTAEQQAGGVGYVLFNEKELQHRYQEKMAYGGIFERFDRDRREACTGTGLFGS